MCKGHQQLKKEKKNNPRVEFKTMKYFQLQTKQSFVNIDF